MAWAVYVLRCADGTLYKGYARCFEDRLKDHQDGKVRWTKSRLPVTVFHVESVSTRELAAKREKLLKSGFGRRLLKRMEARQAGGK